MLIRKCLFSAGERQRERERESERGLSLFNYSEMKKIIASGIIARVILTNGPVVGKRDSRLSGWRLEKKALKNIIPSRLDSSRVLNTRST